MEKIMGDITPKKQLPEALAKNVWVKGQSGNPNGRPKNSISIVDTIRHIFESDPDRFQSFIDRYLADPKNRQHIVDKIDGKPEGSGTNVAIQINQYTGTPEQQALVLEQSVIEVNEALQSGKLKYEDNKIKEA